MAMETSKIWRRMALYGALAVGIWFLWESLFVLSPQDVGVALPPEKQTVVLEPVTLSPVETPGELTEELSVALSEQEWVEVRVHGYERRVEPNGDASRVVGEVAREAALAMSHETTAAREKWLAPLPSHLFRLGRTARRDPAKSAQVRPTARCDRAKSPRVQNMGLRDRLKSPRAPDMRCLDRPESPRLGRGRAAEASRPTPGGSLSGTSASPPGLLGDVSGTRAKPAEPSGSISAAEALRPRLFGWIRRAEAGRSPDDRRAWLG